MASNRRNKRYRQYLQDDNTVLPKTTRWRHDKSSGSATNQPSQTAEEMATIDSPQQETSPEDDVWSNAEENHDNDDDDDDVVIQDDDDDDDVWYNADDSNATDWYQTESVWFDTNDEPQEAEATPDGSKSDDAPIYEGATITIAQSAILILSFAMRHSLTGEALSDLLQLISLHCVITNTLHLSLHRFRTYFASMKAPLIYHKYCSSCEFLIDGSPTECYICNSNFSERNSTSYFIEIPLLFQLQQLFTRPDFHEKLQHRFNRKKKSVENIEDIYDGELYKRFSAGNGFLRNANNISFMWYTDGVPLFKSSKISIWPVFLSINELPINERFKQENMIFGGLWFGKSKASMSSFLKPLHNSLKDLHDNGFKVDCSHCSSILIKGVLLCGTCDLPAKCMVMNMTQFNGKYGCPKCTQEGEVIKVGKGHTRAFPFKPPSINGPKRTHGEFIKHGEESYATNTPVFGVKGPSWLSNVCPDVINGTGIDYMHSVLLGIVRRLLQLWFSPKFSSECFSISNKVDIADQRLSSIKPPYFIGRHPRDIKEQSKFWKASECRAWLFFYSIPVLFGLLGEQYFQHYLLLAESVYILNMDSISHTNLKHSEELLIKFSCMFSVLYGEGHMSANLHQLLHLHDTVEQLGPLWVYSCFSFEGLNGKLVKLFHGTQNPVVQISNAVSTLMKMPALSHRLVEGTPAENLFRKLTTTKYHYKVTETVCEGIHVLGKKSLKRLDDQYYALLCQFSKRPVGTCYIFYRIMMNGVLYHSLNYKTYCRNSCTILYERDGQYCCGQIMFFCKLYPVCSCNVTNCHCLPLFSVVIKKIALDNKCAFLKDDNGIVCARLAHCHTGMITDDYDAVAIQNIIGLAVCVNFSVDKVNVVLRPNLFESD